MPEASGAGIDPVVTELMRTEVPTVAPDDPVATVARRMVDANSPGVVVLDGEALVGIVTEADLIEREAEPSLPAVVPFLDAVFVADAGRPFAEELRRVLAVTARDLMSTPVYSIRASATLTQVATLIAERRINPVPVVDDDLRLIGMVTRADLVRVIARLEGADLTPPAEPAL